MTRIDPNPVRSTASHRRHLSRVAAWGLLFIAVALAVGLALLGVLNRRSVEGTAGQAYEGRALDIGLSSAAALWMLRPRDRKELQSVVTALKDGPIESVAILGARGRILASSEAAERGTRLPPDPALERMLRGEAVHRIRRIGGGDAPRYEVWVVLRPGIRRFHHRGPPRGRWNRGRGPGSPARFDGMRGDREWRRKMRRDRRGGAGRVPWGRAFLRVRLAVVDLPIADAVTRARSVQWATLVGAALLLLLALLAFLADRRASRMQRRLVAQQRFAEMGEMAAVLAHEIRNPLGVIKGYAQLLREKASDDGRETLGRVVSETGRLERLVNALLDYARPAPPQIVQADLEPMVERACELAADEAVARDVRLLRDVEPCRARVDVDQMLQVALNLLRNAVQASAAGGTVTVRLYRRGGEVRLEVRDTGPGLPADLGADIFKPFVTTRSDGTGLGLAISRQIAEAHGGALMAENGREGGAEFRLSLPVGGPVAAPPE